MKQIVHQANSRGLAEHGWLHSRHTFSFADYFDRQRMNFGLLRVINDDIVQPSMGFATHPHENMEIVSIPLFGSLRHQDSMGNQHVIRTGEVQRMSAGTGITHSEYNHSDEEEVNFLQIWVFPKEKNITPGYAQKTYAGFERQEGFQLLVSPDEEQGSIGINQDAWFSLGRLTAGRSLDYRWHLPDNGVYLLVIEGEVEIFGQRLERRDGMGLTEVEKVQISALCATELLVIEVPMQQ